MLALWHWHIEISSKCTLRCPRCSRQEVPSGLVNTELDLEFFKKNFTEDFIRKHVRKITFCGDDGDPIYAHDLVPVIQWFKAAYPVNIVIVTNGSYKSTDWWHSLAQVLDETDEIHFSLDGWDQDSNAKYRVNSDWASIVAGATELRKYSQAHMTWAAIAFEFNQDQLGHMEQLARDIGFDFFQVTRSTKFAKIYPSYGPTDSLQPRDEWISPHMRFDRQITALGTRPQHPIPIVNTLLYRHMVNVHEHPTVAPLCTVGNKGLFINSQGDFFPCCWVANRYGHNSEWLDRGREFNLKQRTLADVVHDAYWREQFQSFHWLECQTKCNKNKVDYSYASSW